MTRKVNGKLDKYKELGNGMSFTDLASGRKKWWGSMLLLTIRGLELRRVTLVELNIDVMLDVLLCV